MLRKLVYRNRGIFAAGTAVAAALVVGLGTSSWLLVREHAVRREAQAAHENEAHLLSQARARESVSEAAILLAEQKFEEADALLAKTPVRNIEPSIEAAGVFYSLGQWNGISRRWKQAADSFALFVQASRQGIAPRAGTDPMQWLGAGPALVEGGNPGAYRQMCEVAVAQFDKEKDPRAVQQLLKACLLLPAEGEVPERLKRLAADQAQTLADEKDPYDGAFRSMSLAMIEYRQGNFEKALQWCRRSLSYPDANESREAGVHAIWAMSAWHHGQKEVARAELASARDYLKVPLARSFYPRGKPQGLWLDWSIARILEREAAALIEPAGRAAGKSP
jgi:hypothetical protein